MKEVLEICLMCELISISSKMTAQTLQHSVGSLISMIRHDTAAGLGGVVTANEQHFEVWGKVTW